MAVLVTGQPVSGVLRDRTRTQLKTVPSQEDRHACWRSGGDPDFIAIDGTWADGSILFGRREGRIYRVAETGGTVTALETLPRKPGQKRLSLPGSCRTADTSWSEWWATPQCMLRRLMPGTRKDSG